MKLPERYERLVLGALIGTVVSLAVYIAGIRKATRERTHVVAEEEFCGRVECKPSPAARFSSANHFEQTEKVNLKINRMPFVQTVFELADGILCMAVKVIEVADSIPVEEGTCHRPMELPELA